MLMIISNVFYVLIAIAMTVLILLQRGAGADAGSGFGGGASGTVFGSRGSANFMSRSTGVLAFLFFVISLGMGLHLSGVITPTAPGDDLGIMAGAAPKPAEAPGNAAPAASEQAAQGEVPKAMAAPASASENTSGTVPAEPAAAASAGKDSDKENKAGASGKPAKKDGSGKDPEGSGS